MQEDVVNAFLKEQFGSNWALDNNVCHMDNDGEYFGTFYYHESLIRMTFIYHFDKSEISYDLAMTLLLLNAHPDLIGRGAFSVTDNGTILLTFRAESEFFTVPELKERWQNWLNWRSGYFDFLDSEFKKK